MKEVGAKIAELRISEADQCKLLLAAPTLNLLLSRDCGTDVAERLEINKPVNSVHARETWNEVSLVLDHAAFEVVRDAGIEDTGPAREDVDVVDHREMISSIPEPQQSSQGPSAPRPAFAVGERKINRPLRSG